ncbi:cytochrome c [bacterium BMS3Abin04]|nr:cytochrome c [bacterium BMS3Abin04]
MKKYKFLFIGVVITLFLIGCGGEKKETGKTATNKDMSKKEKIAKRFGLTVFELDNGIGPIKEKLKLGPINLKMVKEGKAIFETKCASCHKLDERFTGPAQRDVIERRSPEYIMNMILNPEEMLNKHPEAKKMLAVYMTKMTFQNVTKEDARKILEYFRSVDKEKK